MGAHLKLQQIKAQQQEDEIQQFRMRLQRTNRQKMQGCQQMPVEKLNSKFNLHA